MTSMMQRRDLMAICGRAKDSGCCSANGLSSAIALAFSSLVLGFHFQKLTDGRTVALREGTFIAVSRKSDPVRDQITICSASTAMTQGA